MRFKEWIEKDNKVIFSAILLDNDLYYGTVRRKDDSFPLRQRFLESGKKTAVAIFSEFQYSFFPPMIEFKLSEDDLIADLLSKKDCTLSRCIVGLTSEINNSLKDFNMIK